MAMNPELRAKVDAVYASVDAAIAEASPRCESSGKCCRFTEYGHTLFLSHFEAEILLETAPAYAPPITRDGCPFQVGNRCTARAERPLGCRIYFCDPNFQEPQQTITEAAIARLKQLADEYDAGWQYAPLHVFLNAADRPPESSARIALPLVP